MECWKQISFVHFTVPRSSTDLLSPLAWVAIVTTVGCFPQKVLGPMGLGMQFVIFTSEYGPRVSRVFCLLFRFRVWGSSILQRRILPSDA